MINSGREWGWMDNITKTKMNKEGIDKPLPLWFNLVLVLAWSITFICVIWLTNLSN
jgi:hypothetical protein